MPDERFDQELAAAARDMQDEASGKRVDTHATSNDALAQVDALQHELKQGPCLDALRQQDTVHSNDLSTDDRWPKWGPEVASRLGLFSIVSYRLFSTEANLGALNLYGSSKSAFTADDVHDGTALAAHIGVALAGAQEVENLGEGTGGPDRDRSSHRHPDGTVRPETRPSLRPPQQDLAEQEPQAAPPRRADRAHPVPPTGVARTDHVGTAAHPTPAFESLMVQTSAHAASRIVQP
jgi:hypothetical protein